MSARQTALNVLMACRKDGAWSNGVLKTYVLRDHLDRRDAALASRLCYGVLQNRYKLDFYLKQLLTGKLKDLHPAVRDILHLGLYQILEMDKIPESAAVNESVTLAKKVCKNQRFAPGLVNGVLRNAVRNCHNLMQPQTFEERYSHPQMLVDLLRENVGAEALEDVLRANNEIPPTTIQVNTNRISPEQLRLQLEAEGVSAMPHSWMEDCLVLQSTGDLEQLSAFQKGLFYVQDPASKLSVLCAEMPKERHLRVLDCCAAPGGKSFAVAIAMGGYGHITSCDIHPHKVNLIENGASRLGFENIQAQLQDATVFREEWGSSMDVVLVDVPCSGYGIIRKKPDIRYKDPKEMEELPLLQLQILSNQSRYVKPGGVLMYSTCTILRRENEEVIRSFLDKNADFQVEPLHLPDRFEENTTGMLTLLPGVYDTDGFFICRLRRRERLCI